MVPKTPIDKIVMKRIDTGEGEPNETPCISFYNPPHKQYKDIKPALETDKLSYSD